MHLSLPSNDPLNSQAPNPLLFLSLMLLLSRVSYLCVCKQFFLLCSFVIYKKSLLFVPLQSASQWSSWKVVGKLEV